MTLAQSDVRRPTGNRQIATHGRGKLRLALGVAAILAIAAIGAVGGKPASPTPESATDDNGAVTAIESGQAPAFDGRGKWSGYAR